MLLTGNILKWSIPGNKKFVFRPLLPSKKNLLPVILFLKIKVLVKCLKVHDVASNNGQSSLSFMEIQKANVDVKWITSTFSSRSGI